MEFSTKFGNPLAEPSPIDNGAAKLRFLLIGNFLGDAALPDRSSIQLTGTNLEGILERICPQIQYGDHRLSFKSIEDFHPDQLLEQIPPLNQLLKQYRSIQRDGASSPYLKNIANPTTDGAVSDAQDGSAFNKLIGEKSTESSSPSRVDQLVKSAIKGSELVSSEQASAVELALQALETQLSSDLADILHDASFQDLEARWRNLERMTAAIEDDMACEVDLLPLNQAQWQAWLDTPELAIDTIQRRLEMLGQVDAMFLSHRFGPTEGEWTLLQHLSTLASTSGTPLITSGHSSLIGPNQLPSQFDSAEAARIEQSLWSQLKAKLKLDHLYITVQGILTRLPYNSKDDPIEAFQFAEDANTLQPAELLYGDASLMIARIWLEHYFETGSAMMPQCPRSTDDLPLYTQDGELQPVAECWLSDEAADKFQAQGLTPLRSFRNSGQISIYL